MVECLHIILLCHANVADHLAGYLRDVNPAVRVDCANSLDALGEAVARAEGPVRLLAFLTDVIVPADLLGTAGLTGYNIHPGPPEYPGSAPTSFAIWEEAERFGATAHVLAARVDEGPIVATRPFPMPPEPEERGLGDLAFAIAVELFGEIGRHCALSTGDLPPSGEVWTGVKRRRADLERLKATLPLLGAEDRARLMRACSDLRPPPAGSGDLPLAASA